jgi:hypothetical protein
MPIYKQTEDGLDVVDGGYAKSTRELFADSTTALWCPVTHQPVRVEVKYRGTPRGEPGKGVTRVKTGPATYIKTGEEGAEVEHRTFLSKASRELPLAQPVMTYMVNGFSPGIYVEVCYELPIGVRADVVLIARRLPV